MAKSEVPKRKWKKCERVTAGISDFENQKNLVRQIAGVVYTKSTMNAQEVVTCTPVMTKMATFNDYGEHISCCKKVHCPLFMNTWFIL